MSYLVLARRYRPQSFDEVVGQKHITDLLKEAICTKRLAHAFLFCGPRGIGKTSCARILAKSLNCKDGPTVSPCGHCPACREIAQATSFDVIEIDGASNRGIDEIRTLRENVKFAPSYGRYKIYIVDEVHMLTTEAFNALLKTLEEPPEYVKFILATTSPNKVLPTIISRCQRFDFYRISVTLLTDTLATISKKEKLKINEEALFAIAKAASGSLRDALSILDQMGALSRKDITAEDVTTMLGTVEIGLLFELVDCLGKKECAAALSVLDKIITQGKDIRQLGRDLIEHFRNLMVMKVGGKALGSLVDYPVAAKETLLAQSQKFTLKEIIKSIDIFMECQENTWIMDSLRIPLEVAFAQLTYRAEAQPQESELPKTSGHPGGSSDTLPSANAENHFASPIKVLTNKKGHVDFTPDHGHEDGYGGGDNFVGGQAKNDVPTGPDREQKDDPLLGLEDEKKVSGDPLSLEHIRRIWDSVTHAISREKMSVATYLQEGSPYEVKGSRLTIGFPEEASFHKESLEHKDRLCIIERVFSDKLKADIKVDFKIVADHKPQEDEPFIKTALETFKGKVVSKWHSDTKGSE